VKQFTKRLLKTGASTVTGGALGAGTYDVIGGIGVAATGTAVSVTLAPLIVVGSGLGAAAYGLYWLGSAVTSRRMKRSA
jgi:hypothetical protein